MAKRPNAKSFNLEDMILFWREHPVQAALDIFGDQSLPADHEERFALDKPQQLVLKSRWTHTDQTDVFTRGGGKTFLNAVTAVLAAVLYPGNKVGLIGPSFRQCLVLGEQPYPFFTSDGMVNSTGDLQRRLEAGPITVQSLQAVRTIAAHWVNPPSPVLKVSLSRGFRVAGKPEHRVLVLDPHMDLAYRELSDLQIGDHVVVRKGMQCWGSTIKLPWIEELSHWAAKPSTLPTEMDEELAYLMGLLVGDGCISITEGRSRIQLTNSDPRLICQFRRSMRRIFGRPSSKGPVPGKPGLWQPGVNSVRIARFLVACGMTTTTALDKRVPDVIARAPQEMVAAFLRGLFDTDGSVDRQDNYVVADLSTSSLELAYQVQAMLLNMGVMSAVGLSVKAGERSLIGRKKLSVCAPGYKVRICGQRDVATFMEQVGFGLRRKTLLLQRYFAATHRVGNADVIPHSHDTVGRLADACRERLSYHSPIANAVLSKIRNRVRFTNANFTRHKVQDLLDLSDRMGVQSDDHAKLRRLTDLDLSFVEVTGIEHDVAPTLDVEVPEESCYWAAGLIHHNSKMMWSEIERLYEMSPFIQESCADSPKITPEKCYLKFRAAEGRIGSIIEALPLGSDGSKIRGARYYWVFSDEDAQIDKHVKDVVVGGFTATSANPMKKVRRVQRLQRELAEGLITQDEFDAEMRSGNKTFASSTAFFQYNHLWEDVQQRIESIYQEKQRLIRRGEPHDHLIIRGGPINGGQVPARYLSDGQRALTIFPYTDMSPGFMDITSILANRLKMSEYMWLMEYCCYFPPDSEGFYRRSLLDSCRQHGEFGPVLGPRKGCIYAMGIDPARSSDNFAISIWEIDESSADLRLVRVVAYNNRDFPLMHQEIRRWKRHYDVKLIKMDAGGGGTAVRDLLADPMSCPLGEKLILEQGFDGHIGKQGERILGKLVEFANYQWCHDTNFNLKAALEHHVIKIAAVPPVPGHVQIWTKDLEDADDELEKAMAEWATIVTTVTSHGRLHWDTPTRTQRKDRYSAILIGFDAASELAGRINKPVKLASGFWG